ncbi:LRR receptor-like serine/threonine-protein kinase FLS2 [Solanum verrucosum]|uniref:LRR receptor-like serine/threonine-protein kinase FLS2 n=1 Tax=Solanum verrucosum TaxID=315347 RepID=UPI0020D098F9|nr:LRR receptor-like serine/threonine-protein kinase FLS2 [Solanum verrucosum]
MAITFKMMTFMNMRRKGNGFQKTNPFSYRTCLHSSFALAILILLLHHHTSLATIINIYTDKASLPALKSRIYSDRNNILARNWSSSIPVCNWIGFTRGSRHHRVTALDIFGMQLYGTIPPHIGNLSFLVSLDISDNTFHGRLPEEFAHLRRNLRVLWIGDNLLDGVLPPSIGNLSKHLDSFDGSGCKLKDVIPQEIEGFNESNLLGNGSFSTVYKGILKDGTLLAAKSLYRLDITIDVASAIDYLHNGYSTPVVHCDLKPNNVLIDHETVAHVSDFGIAKMFGAGEAFVQTRTFATIGYFAPGIS